MLCYTVLCIVILVCIMWNYASSFSDPPNKPEFDYCTSYNNGQSSLQMTSHVRILYAYSGCVHLQMYKIYPV